ncbi:ATPase [Micromonospora acroterricola]|uniref:ATPase n=1 Tax=Micromonospora acroterricola TaxID=2202421 RepID=A0A317D8B5_9ACTN|nr:ATPase [Micromonospora acroterricola]PWR11098.1 ATPase [Micromonospora acroterricola]
MRFSVVETGYDQRQVDSCLDELGIRLSRLAARAEGAAGAERVWDEIREEAAWLSGLLQRLDLGDTAVTRHAGDPVRREAAGILARARMELDEAREEARQVRERAYADAVQARRDFEAALYARRRREARVDEILTGVTVDPVPADTPTAAAGTGVPATRAAAGGVDVGAEPPTGRDGARSR